MMAYWVDYGFSFVNSAAQFRVPLALQIVFAVVTLAGILVLPESPRWVRSFRPLFLLTNLANGCSFLHMINTRKPDTSFGPLNLTQNQLSPRTR